MKLYVLVGVAGAGKSTYADKLIAEYDGKGYIFSSDDYRRKIFGSLKEGNERENNPVAFSILHEDLKNAIKDSSKEFFIYDATNISRRRRRALYRNVKQWSDNKIEVEIIYFSQPLIKLLEVNEYRSQFEPDKSIPEKAILRMYKTLQVPRNNVDCDSFRVVGTPMFDYELLKQEATSGAPYIQPYPIHKLYDSSLNNMGGELNRIFESHDCEPWHLENIHTHIEMCIDNKLAISDTMKTISAFHDLGKSITKQMIEKDGSIRATYRHHANVSANYLLNYLHFLHGGDLGAHELDMIEVVMRHMDMHNGLGEKNIRNNKLNNNVIRMLEIFAEIDSNSRVMG